MSIKKNWLMMRKIPLAIAISAVSVGASAVGR